MFRSAVLLLIVGLAVGLWLGFNPQAHQQTIQKWDSVKSAYLKFMTDATAKIQGLNSHISTSPVRQIQDPRSVTSISTRRLHLDLETSYDCF